MSYNKVMPKIDADSQTFWQGCQEGRLMIPKCEDCGHRFMPPRSLCPKCSSIQIQHEEVSGQGIVYSAVTYHHAFHPGWKEETPYNVSLIELDCGARIFSNVIGIPPEQVRIGMPVQVEFQTMTDELTLPQFRPKEG